MAVIARAKKREFKGTAIETGDYRVTVCSEDHIHLNLPKLGAAGDLAFDADEAWELAQALLRGYDVAVGIAGPPQT